MNTACGICGANPAKGYAAINDTRYCHPDDWSDENGPDCYMLAQGLTITPIDLTGFRP